MMRTHLWTSIAFAAAVCVTVVQAASASLAPQDISKLQTSYQNAQRSGRQLVAVTAVCARIKAKDWLISKAAWSCSRKVIAADSTSAYFDLVDNLAIDVDTEDQAPDNNTPACLDALNTARSLASGLQDGATIISHLDTGVYYPSHLKLKRYTLQVQQLIGQLDQVMPAVFRACSSA